MKKLVLMFIKTSFFSFPASEVAIVMLLVGLIPIAMGF